MSNALKKIQEAVRRGEAAITPGTITLATARHDPGCSIFAGGECDCEPVVKITTPAMN